MEEAILKLESPTRTPHRRAWAKVSGLEWAIFGSSTVFLIGLLIFSLFFAHQKFLRTAQAWDLDRVEGDARLCRDRLEAKSLAKPSAQILREMQKVGLTIEVFPPEQEIPRSNPRYVPKLGAAEAWERVRAPDGQTVSVIRIARRENLANLALAGVRTYTLAAALGGALVIGFIWLVLRRTVFRKIDNLTTEVARDGGEPFGPGEKAGGGLGSLQTTVRAALAARDRHAAQLEALLASHSELACSSTSQGKLLGVNEAYVRLVRKSREELIGSNYLDLIRPADRAQAVASVQQLSRRNPVTGTDYQIVLPDGAMRSLRWKNTAVFGEDDEVKEVFSTGTDITAEKYLEERVAKLQIAFTQMQSLARTGRLVWNLSRNQMEWTDETWRLLGLEKDACPASLDNLLAMVSTEDRGPLRELFRQACENGSPFEYEFRCLLPDGSCRFLQSRAEVRADPKTKLLDQLTCTLHDITALRDAESATQRELRFRQAIEQSLGTGIILSDEKGKNVLVNPAFCKMTGWSADELIGQSAPYCYGPEEENPAIRGTFERTMRGEAAPEGLELRFGRKDGTRFDVLLKVAPLCDDDDRPLGWLGAVTDITPMQRTRRELQATNERLRIAQEVAGFGIWDWDPVKDILHWDRQSFALFGHPDATDPQTVWKKVHSEAQQERLTYLINRLITAGATSGQDLFSVRWPDATAHDISSTYVILRDQSGRTTRVLGINRDVTAELEEERDLRDANERLAATLEGEAFGTFEHVTGVGDINWSPMNYEIHGIDPSVSHPAELFAMWKAGVGDFFPELMNRMAALPVTKKHFTYELTFRPCGQAPRLIRSSVFVERNGRGHPTRLVGFTRRLDPSLSPVS